MKLGKRLFPYPLLNSNPELSTYTLDSTYKLEVDLVDGCPEIINQDVYKRQIFDCVLLPNDSTIFLL